MKRITVEMKEETFEEFKKDYICFFDSKHGWFATRKREDTHTYTFAQMRFMTITIMVISLLVGYSAN